MKLAALLFVAAGDLAAQVAGAHVSLEIRPESYRYCRGDGQVNFLAITGAFTFTNQHKTPVLLLRDTLSGDAPVANIRVAKSKLELKSGKLVMDLTPLRIDMQELAAADPTHFIRLEPGQISHHQATFTIPVLASEGVDPKWGLAPGNYVAIVSIAAWPGSAERARQITTQTFARGSAVVMGSIQSDSMPFSVARSPAGSCTSPSR